MGRTESQDLEHASADTKLTRERLSRMTDAIQLMKMG